MTSHLNYSKAVFHLADGANLRFADQQFYIIISSGTLIHVPNYREHIAETSRVAQKYMVAHRTLVCRQKPTQYFKKFAYGVETVELRFNETDLLSEFTRNGLKLIKSSEYYTNPNADEFEVTYLFSKEES